MDPSRRESAATPQQQQQHDTSSLVSPTDLRQPLGRFQSRDDEGLSESFHSTDTVRRRPEPNYGACILLRGALARLYKPVVADV